jgi:hypothetical protein
MCSGWQNFFICIEMCLAAVALRFAFPHENYLSRESYLPTSTSSTSSQGTSGLGGRIVTMQSISNNLKETMNPKDIMHGEHDCNVFTATIGRRIVSLSDAIHNFHPQYRDYTQYSAQVSDRASLLFIDRRCL